MTETAASYLDIYLGPLRDQLARADVTDLYINRPHELWIEVLGGGIERHDAPEVTEALLWRLARQVASVTHQGISREHPLLAARLPDGARIQIVAPPATRGPMAVAIRKHVSAQLSLADYGTQGAFDTTRGGGSASAVDAELSRLHGAGEWEALVRLAVRAKKTILVSGGTSTGKTTFLNALIREIPAHERLLLIEDTPELAVEHDNLVGLVAVRGTMGEARVTSDDLLTASLRMRPDRIILGEIRGPEALAFLRAVNTGHPGSLSTIHANSPAQALEQLALLILQAGTSLRRSDIIEYARNVINVVVQMDNREGRRVISEVNFNAATSA